jgi:molybdopterin-guanine dinucleotide biosynthesis protein A
VNCYVLTGGRSSRLGRSKADLFLHRIAAAASLAFDDVIAVQHDGEAWTDIQTIFDEPSAREGSVFGVIRALEHAGARCFILATDYPLITADALRDLRSRFEKSAAPLFVPVWEGIPQVLCAGYAPELLPLIRRRAANGKLDLRGLIGESDAVTVEVSGDTWLNVNTPADLQKAQRLL